MQNLLASVCSLKLFIATIAYSLNFGAAPVLAQTLPAVYEQRDEFGVDLTTGGFKFKLIEGSIGSGPGAIGLERSHSTNAPLDNLTVRFERNVTGAKICWR